MKQINVREAVQSDMENLAIIQTQSWRAAFKNILCPATIDKYTNVEECSQMLNKVYEANKGTFYIGYIGDKPCGEVFWRKDEESLDTAEIVAVHSISESWGSGLGRAMMERALQDIRKSKLSKVFLWVFKENHRACRYYEKCGFQNTDEEKVSTFGNAIEVKYVKYL